MFPVLLLYALFAACFTTAKSALFYSQPLFLVGSRMALAGMLLLGYTFLKEKKMPRLGTRSLFSLFLLSIFNIYLTNIFEFWGLQHLSSFKTCLIYSLSPFLSALFSYCILNEKLSVKKWVGLLLGFIGMGPILLLDGSASEELSGRFFLFSWAELSVLAAVFCGVYGWVLLRQVVSREEVPPLFANGFSMLIGGMMALVHSLSVEEWNPYPVTEWMPFLGYFVILLVISNLLAYNLYGYLLRRYTATFMSVAGSTTPLFAALFGWYFLNEEVGAAFYASCGILFVGLTVFHQEELCRS